METLAAIHSRFSSHSFRDKKISWTTLGKLITASIQAPNSGNLQSFRFVIVTKDNLKEELGKASFNQAWIAQAQVIIIICSDMTDIERYYKDNGKKYALQDASAAAENLILAATDLSIQSCWIGAFNEGEVSMILRLPPFVIPQIIIPLGYSDEKKTQPRHHMEFLINFNEYGNKERSPYMFPVIDKIEEKTNHAGKQAKKFSAKLKEKFKRKPKR